jgi:16S rRNA (guanine527-N7)-methyltransferase
MSSHSVVCFFLFVLAKLLAIPVEAFQRTNTLSFHLTQANSRVYPFLGPIHRKLSLDESDDSETSSTSLDYAMEPDSVEAQSILENLGLSDIQRNQLISLSKLVVEWNDRINLISRKDCSVPVVFGRHVLPCLAPLGFDVPIIHDNQLVVDVGTGGGFPGLPLAIAYPEVNFLLVDSVGKKLGAVQNMADRLGLPNVRTHHGRAEELQQSFDVCVGRSVAPIPKYCFWIQRLLKKEGKLCYMIGGDIDEELLSQTTLNVSIDQLLNHPGASDKRVLVFPQIHVVTIAAKSGEVARNPNPNAKQKREIANNARRKESPGKREDSTKNSKGAWNKRDNSVPKQRGYENFKRFDSSA